MQLDIPSKGAFENVMSSRYKGIQITPYTMYFETMFSIKPGSELQHCLRTL